MCATAMSPTAWATDSRCMKQTRRFQRFIDRLDDNKKDCYECSAACRLAELRRRATNTDHRSDSGTAIGRVCVCLCVCSDNNFSTKWPDEDAFEYHNGVFTRCSRVYSRLRRINLVRRIHCIRIICVCISQFTSVPVRRL